MEFKVKKITAQVESGLEMSLGEVIKLYRKRENLTQAELARLVGVTGKTISNYENDSTVPDVETFRRFCSILKIPSRIKFREPFDELLTLYCPDGELALDRNGKPLCDTRAIKSELFMAYGCRKCDYSCVKLWDSIYLLYNETKFTRGNTYLVKFPDRESLIMAKYNGKSYTDIKTGEKTVRIDAVISRVLGEVTEYEIME